ncbi:MAG TPA: hypothetical protein VHN15_09660 [Thermoanaerobaculia bacterium]|nr:hypothetical protein [Thermoanaerobaculia bacterium]
MPLTPEGFLRLRAGQAVNCVYRRGEEHQDLISSWLYDVDSNGYPASAFTP